MFIGSVKFSEIALQEIISLNGNIVGVCTLAGSAFNSDYVDLTPLAEAFMLPVIYSNDINSIEVLKTIKEWAPDVIFCFGWSRLIKKPLLDLPRLGVIGFHPAPLPSNRGRHPIIWSLALGLSNTASTFFFMDEQADTGDILSQVEIPISKDDDASTLYEKISKTAIIQIKDFLPKLSSGVFIRQPQGNKNENTWRKRSQRDGLIDWRMSAESIHNLVRALTRPYPGAELQFKGFSFKVWRTQIVKSVPANFEYGKVISVSNGKPLIKAGEGAILLLEVSPELDLKPGDYL